MKKITLLSLILMILISCGTKQKSTKNLSESDRWEQVFGEFKIHYQRLLTFKNTPDFKANVFEAGSLNNAWLDKVKKLQENPDSKLLLKNGVDVGELEQLGLAYANSKGIETDVTIKINKIFEDAILQQQVENVGIKSGNAEPNKPKSVFELFSQFPVENILYPNGLKNNPIVHPYQETYVDSSVHPNSITGLNRVYSYVSEPTYMVFPANEANNKKIGLIIFPGGGLRNIWLDKEGTDIAFWFSQQGITCMVVKYRTNRRQDGAGFEIDMDVYNDALVQDARKSLQTLKSLADSLNFDKEKVGVMGFSSGGYVAQLLTYRDYNENLKSIPDFAALIYINDFLEKFEKVDERKNLPPFFLAASSNDYRLNIAKTIKYLGELAVGVPKSELHIYRDGGHGFGLAYDENGSVKDWKNAFINWLISLN